MLTWLPGIAAPLLSKGSRHQLDVSKNAMISKLLFRCGGIRNRTVIRQKGGRLDIAFPCWLQGEACFRVLASMEALYGSYLLSP